MRQALVDILRDPETRRLILTGGFQVEGSETRDNYIAKFGSDTPVETATPIFEKDGNKIGIGTTDPATRLSVYESGSSSGA